MGGIGQRKGGQKLTSLSRLARRDAAIDSALLLSIFLNGSNHSSSDICDNPAIPGDLSHIENKRF
jgi:hypothetical protein